MHKCISKMYATRPPQRVRIHARTRCATAQLRNNAVRHGGHPYLYVCGMWGLKTMQPCTFPTMPSGMTMQDAKTVEHRGVCHMRKARRLPCPLCFRNTFVVPMRELDDSGDKGPARRNFNSAWFSPKPPLPVSILRRHATQQLSNSGNIFVTRMLIYVYMCYVRIR